MVYILPYIEQNAIYSKWQFSSSSGYTNANNNALVAQKTIPIYRCPSSSVPDFMASRGGIDGRLMNVSYTGIAGSALGTTGKYNVGCCNGSGPFSSDLGILFAGSRVAMTAITDGTSNTWMVAEQSDHLRDVNRQPITGGYTAGVGNSGGLYGWTMGAQTGAASAATWGDGRHFNCTTVRYTINKTGFTNSAAEGTNNDVGTNFPLNSGHTGGINVCLGDGSVRFFTDSLDIAQIHNFSTRAGGEINVE